MPAVFIAVLTVVLVIKPSSIIAIPLCAEDNPGYIPDLAVATGYNGPWPHQLAFSMGIYETRRQVSLTLNEVTPIMPGQYTNVSLKGFEEFDLVYVFISYASDVEHYYKLDVSGKIGYLQFQFPCLFEPWSRVRVGAFGIPIGEEQRRNYIKNNNFAVAAGKESYLVGQPPPAGQEVSHLAPYGQHHISSRTSASVWIDGNPTFIRRSNPISIMWAGISSSVLVQVGLVCPQDSQKASCVAATRNYNTIPVSYTMIVPQNGCYVTITQGSLNATSGRCDLDFDTTIASLNTYVMIS